MLFVQVSVIYQSCSAFRVDGDGWQQWCRHSADGITDSFGLG